jgi:histidine triad (HIT) family protein
VPAVPPLPEVEPHAYDVQRSRPVYTVARLQRPSDTPLGRVLVMSEDCLFCKVVAGEIPADIVHRGDTVLSFRDINPQAPTHVLVVPVDHHADVATLAAADPAALAELVAVGRQVATAEGHDDYRLVFNTGPRAGQSVFHVHGHVLAGRDLSWPPG